MGEQSHEALLRKVSSWTEAREDIRALILTGSYAQDQADTLSDLDLEVFTRDPRRYSESDGWLSEIGSVWTYIPEQDDAGNPARLVIFEGGLKVDFSIFPMRALAERVAAPGLRPLYDRGYRILVDKDHLAGKLAAPSGRPVKIAPPTEEQFVGLIREFWFKAYHVAKYLKRGDLVVCKIPRLGTQRATTTHDRMAREVFARLGLRYEASRHSDERVGGSTRLEKIGQ